MDLHVVVEGPEDGPGVLLVHGFAGSVDLSWRATGVLDRLVAARRRVVAFDLRGHGRTTGAEVFGDAALAADVGAVAAAHGVEVVVGYSMGAALVLVALERGLLPASVRAAVVGAAPPAVLRWTEADDAQVAVVVDALLGGHEEEDGFGMIGGPALAGWVAMLDESGADRFGLAGVLAAHRPVVEDWAAVEASGVAVTLVAGGDDGMAAPLAELSARLPSAAVVPVPGDHLAASMSEGFVRAILDASAG